VHDERTLLARARALDEDALAEVHDTYYRPLYRYIVYRVGDRQAAEDLTSEVFVRLLNALRDHTAPENTLRGWLYGVASHVVSDHHRKQYRRQDVTLTETIATTQPGPAAKVAARLSWEEVSAALSELTELQQEVIALRFGQELPIKEVGALMGRSEGAVKQLQARAVASLARILRETAL
jgi:RNA polymerase sigma-70 factor (ECF subfamily)